MLNATRVRALLFYSAIIALVFFAGWLLADDVTPAAYLGSDQCQACHGRTHREWANSLHHKMMRRVEQEGVVVADLSAATTPFNAADAVWAIGSKWQQQFMGLAGGRETLLPGTWSVDTQQWRNQGWDGWQVPDPIVRCHGCHTVGLDLATGTFVEPGIGCESCHGPASQHVESNGRFKLSAGVDAALCGQCHSRGMAKDGKAFFPYAYQPGEDLDQHFTHSEADFLQNSSQWWGTGREKKRHQEYAAWRRGGHVNALKSITENYDGRYGTADESCLHCHSGEAAIRTEDHGLDLGEVVNGITCAVCHNTHGNLPGRRRDCTSCHGQSASHHQPEPLVNHIPCPVEANVQCIDCHMPLTVKMGGEFLLHSHAPGITEPAAAAIFNSPSSCVNGACHQASDQQWLQQQFDAFYRAQTPSSMGAL